MSGQPAVNLATTYTYDHNGNLETKTEKGILSTYAHDTLNQLKSLKREAGEETQTFGFSYDHAGNLTSNTYPGQNQDTFSYNSRNLLESKTLGGITTIGYVYDPNGNLVQRHDNLRSDRRIDLRVGPAAWGRLEGFSPGGDVASFSLIFGTERREGDEL